MNAASETSQALPAPVLQQLDDSAQPERNHCQKNEKQDSARVASPAFFGSRCRNCHGSSQEDDGKNRP
jgi:hypothetical protein